MAVAYDAMLRRSELSALQAGDFVEEIEGYATLLVRWAKTDPEGRGAAVYLARDTVALVREWLSRSGIEDGRLFRSLSKGGVLGAKLHPSQIPRIFKAMASRAGLPPELVAGLSGHSARVGAAQDMVASGIEMPAILQAGRWKTTVMVNRYGERLLARRSGPAQASEDGRARPQKTFRMSMSCRDGAMEPGPAALGGCDKLGGAGVDQFALDNYSYREQ